MARVLANFVCQQCGYISPSFLGKCPECGEWNSLVETATEGIKDKRRGIKDRKIGLENRKPVRLSEVAAAQTKRITTGMAELDRVLGGGLVPGMAVLLAGEPGIGKSTLLLQLADSLWHIARGKNHELRATGHVLYIAGEESASQIKIRAERLKVKTENLLVLEETDVDEVLSHLSELRSLSLTIIDSVQTLTTQDLNGTAGSVGQVRECAARLIRAAKQAGTPLFLVGHVTKEGAIAGPKVLEHAVDTVLNFEGDRYQDLRLVRAAKNRFGPTDEVGIFRMTDSGLQPEADLHGFTAETTGTTDAARVGSCLTVIMEGTRPILLEIQALTTATPLPAPRRVGSGVDYNRLQMIVAVLQKRLNLPLYKEDIYVNVSGGIAIREPAGDLACALAILSSYRSKPLPAKTIAVGEIDLLGGVRGVNSLERRIKEARGLGYKNILSAGNLRNLQDFKF